MLVGMTKSRAQVQPLIGGLDFLDIWAAVENIRKSPFWTFWTPRTQSSHTDWSMRSCV